MAIRMPPEMLAAVDEWRGETSRSEAVRELIKAGMQANGIAVPRATKPEM